MGQLTLEWCNTVFIGYVDTSLKDRIPACVTVYSNPGRYSSIRRTRSGNYKSASNSNKSSLKGRRLLICIRNPKINKETNRRVARQDDAAPIIAVHYVRCVGALFDQLRGTRFSVSDAGLNAGGDRMRSDE